MLLRFDGDIEKAKLHPETVLELAVIHLSKYSRQLSLAFQGEPGYRLGENRELVCIWSSVKNKGGVWETFSLREKQEVADALLDEGYDNIDDIAAINTAFDADDTQEDEGVPWE